MNDQKSPKTLAISLGLLNLSGFGLGYLFLKRWVRWGIHFLFTIALLATAILTNASKLPLVWVSAIGLWLLWMTFDGWRLGRNFTLEEGLLPANFLNNRLWLLIIISFIVLVLEGVGLTGYYILGQIDFQQGVNTYKEADCVGALDHFKRVTTLYELTLSSKIATADVLITECDMLLLAENSHEAGNFEEAIELYQGYLNAYPRGYLAYHTLESQATSYFEWAAELKSDKKYKEAVNNYLVILKEYPDTSSANQVAPLISETYISLASQLWETKDYQEAIEAARIPLEHYSSTQSGKDAPDQISQIYYDWAVYLQSQALYEDAVEKILILLDEFPDTQAGGYAAGFTSELYYDWATHLMNNGEYQESIAKFEIVLDKHIGYFSRLEIEGVIKTAYLAWATHLLENESFQNAITRYQYLLKHYPHTITAEEVEKLILEVHFAWGDALYQEGEFADALEKFTQAKELTTDPDLIQSAEEGCENALRGLGQDTGSAGAQIVKDAFATACDGNPASSPAVGSAENEPGKALACSSDPSIRLPQDLKAEYPGHFQYVVSASEGYKTIQTCRYQGGRSVIRQQQYWIITVRSTITGKVYSSKYFYGSMPAKCDSVEWFSGTTKYKYGSEPSMDDVIAWLKAVIR